MAQLPCCALKVGYSDSGCVQSVWASSALSRSPCFSLPRRGRALSGSTTSSLAISRRRRGGAVPARASSAEEYSDSQRVVVRPPPTQYEDSPADLAFMHLCRQAFGRLAGWQSPRPWPENYLGMVEVSHALMRGRSAQEQQAAVLQGFPSVPEWFRRLFPYSDWGAEVNAAITPIFFSWLVGPCHVEDAEILPPAPSDASTSPPEPKVLRSAVKIDKCRYLETSGCVGMCVNLCKMPTQYFFNQELGMPLTMEPNFQDLSCRMIFGQAPPAAADDPALSQPCFASCPTGNSKQTVCPRLS